MAALDFPTPPWTNGQVYGNYIYSTATGAWLSKPLTGPKSTYGPTPPLNPGAGDEWVNSNDMTAYGWYVDTDGGQWVEKTAPISANGYYSPNYIINGDFGINQRAFSSSTSNFIYGFDRWLNYYSSGTTTFSKQSFTPNELTGQSVEPTNFMRVVTTGQTGASAEADISQRIEDVRTLAGQTATISFWARAASGTPSVAVSLIQGFGTGGSPSSAVNTAVKKTAITSSWARYTMTVSVPSISGKIIGTNNDSSLAIVLWTSAGSDFNARTNSLGLQNVTIDFWGVQVELGSTATAFRRNANSIQGELAACQRYYWRAGGQSLFQKYGLGIATSGPTCQIYIPLPVAMRIPPTTTEWNGPLAVFDGSTSIAVTSVTFDQSSSTLPSLTFSVSGGLTATRPAVIQSSNSTSTYVALSAEF